MDKVILYKGTNGWVYYGKFSSLLTAYMKKIKQALSLRKREIFIRPPHTVIGTSSHSTDLSATSPQKMNSSNKQQKDSQTLHLRTAASELNVG